MAANQDIHHGQTRELAPVKHGHDHAMTEQNIQHFQCHWVGNLIYKLRPQTNENNSLSLPRVSPRCRCSVDIEDGSNTVHKNNRNDSQERNYTSFYITVTTFLPVSHVSTMQITHQLSSIK